MRDQHVSSEQSVFLKSLIEQREAGKKGKLEYLTHTPEGMSSFPLLGSAVRALGKGWHVGVVAAESTIDDYIALQEMLKDAEQLSIVSEHDAIHPSKGNGARLIILDSIADDIGKWFRDHALGKAHVLTAGKTNPMTDDYDLVSEVHEIQYAQSGVTAFTGDGKGKTTGALGMAVAHAVADGGNVAVVQWYKEKWDEAIPGQFPINEHFFPQLLKDPVRIQFFPMGVGFFGSPHLDRVASQQEQRAYALSGLEKAKQVLQSEEFSVVVLDEMIDPVEEISGFPKLLELSEVREVLEIARENSGLAIVTGRKVTDAWDDMIGISYVVENKWHPFSDTRYGRKKQQFAQAGIDY